MTALGFWNSKLIAQVMVFAAIVFTAIILLLSRHIVDTAFVFGGFFEIVLFFTLSNRLFHWWKPLGNARFEWNLFFSSLLLRVVAVFALYYFYLHQTGEPFEYFAVDSKFYHANALRLAERFRAMDFNIAGYLADMSYSDRGFNIYLGAVYSVLGDSILASRLVNALLSTLSVLLIYRTARFTFQEHVGRIAAITAMLLPNFLLYLGTGLKETLMVFLVTAFLYAVTKFVLLKRRNVYWSVIIIAVIFCSFLFRTVLAAVMITSFVLYGLITAPARSRTINIAATLLLVAAFIFILAHSPALNEISETIGRKNAVADHMEFRANREGGNKLAVMAGAPLFVSIVLIAPFPSLVFVPEQNILWMFIGANFIRNIYAWFTILGIIYIITTRNRSGSLLLLFAFGYLAVLANSGFAISERFHMPALPALIILSAAGISYRGNRMQKYFPFYLAALAILEIGWNYVKMMGRM